ncbi:MAG TPA: toll/interleukin-1 receptor domain-containing protein [Anaerolineae bacterium]
MSSAFKYDVFLSFSHDDSPRVREIYEKLTEYGLGVFWSERKLEKGVAFPPQLEEALIHSRHFALYCSAAAARSDWVHKECDIFLTQCHMKDKKHRRMYVLMDANSCEDDVFPFLKDLQRPDSPADLITELVRTVTAEQKHTLGLLQNELEQERHKVGEAQKYYRYNRFWGPISENKEVHIFTCARDVAHDPRSMRGSGGRTNIDMWDYRAVLDITHFLASTYPSTHIFFEDPKSKLHGVDLEKAAQLANRISHMRGMLENKDCIIIGSPDVSDFAEIVLAEIHQMAPYTEGRTKKKGFVIIKEPQHSGSSFKEQPYASSSFYWKKEAEEDEGVAQILGPGQYKYFANTPASEASPGKLYGILVVANNPFCRMHERRKIIILSGFSGVATNAIAKLLTDERCLPEFFKLDNMYADTNRDVEALVGVKYIVDEGFDAKDTRRILDLTDYPDAITCEKLVEIRTWMPHMEPARA